jgi:hypothetical protein
MGRRGVKSGRKRGVKSRREVKSGREGVSRTHHPFAPGVQT